MGVARIGKTANCSWCSANTHVFVQIRSHPHCVCLMQIFNSMDWIQLPCLSLRALTDEAPSMWTAARKHGAIVAALKIEAVSVKEAYLSKSDGDYLWNHWRVWCLMLPFSDVEKIILSKQGRGKSPVCVLPHNWHAHRRMFRRGFSGGLSFNGEVYPIK